MNFKEFPELKHQALCKMSAEAADYVEACPFMKPSNAAECLIMHVATLESLSGKDLEWPQRFAVLTNLVGAKEDWVDKRHGYNLDDFRKAFKEIMKSDEDVVVQARQSLKPKEEKALPVGDDYQVVRW